MFVKFAKRGTSTPLTGSAKAVLRHLVEFGAATRPEVGTALGFSRPTMSAAITELGPLVEEAGAVQGSIGRKAVKYRIGVQAGHIIAVDAGTTHIRLRVSTLDFRLLHSRVFSLSGRQSALEGEISHAVADEVLAAISETRADWGPLRGIGVAVPTRVVGVGRDASTTRQNDVFAAFVPPDDIDLTLVNNVNCAAVAEREYGAAKGYTTLAYIQVGVKIGMGLILNGRLISGSNGAAGEVSHLSYPFAPGMAPDRGSLESYLGTEGWLQRVREGWPSSAGAPPVSTANLLEMAERGHLGALEHVHRHAADIGAMIASCVSVVDPDLIVLGGGLGASPVLLPLVQETTSRLAFNAEVRSTMLGVDATVLGIEKLANEQALRRLLSEDS